VAVDEEISQAITTRLGVQGVLLLRVEPGSSAERAGLRGTRVSNGDQVIPGDIIQRIDGQPIARVSEMLDTLAAHRLGDRLLLSIWRNGEQLDVAVLLGPSNR
jgi:S1-C subfamily serine protease